MYEVTSKSSVHGIKTAHGFKTPHRFPMLGVKTLTEILSDLANQLYPTGRAWYMPKGGVSDNTHLAFNKSFIRLIGDADATIDSVFPDNDNFSEQDCAIWEYRFGITNNSALNILDRRKALYRRMGRGRNVHARQHKDYIQYQLQLAGFNVFVHENGFIEEGIRVYKKPEDIIALNFQNVQHGGISQHGVGLQHGYAMAQVIANSISPNEIQAVNDNNLWATFFIGGENLGDMAEVLSTREREFRELVLKLKPAHLIAFTFINYV